MKDLENKANLRNETPADQLLLELNTKMCTVEILCTLLENCDLPNILSILQLPGIKNKMKFLLLLNKYTFKNNCLF